MGSCLAGESLSPVSLALADIWTSLESRIESADDAALRVNFLISDKGALLMGSTVPVRD
jgi:hypothetical protein